MYRITVEETFQDYKHPHDMRFHNLKYIEKVVDVTGGRTFRQNRSGGSTNGKSTTTYSISDLFDFVKIYDKEFKPNSVSEYLIDKETGFPKVFYLADTADADWSKGVTVYQKERANTQPVYISSYAEAGKKPNFEIKENGDVIVYDAGRVKSATDNIGTFDTNSKKIQYSRKASTDGAALETGGQEYIRGGLDEKTIVHYSKDENSSIKQQLREHLDEVNAMEPVANIKYEVTTKQQAIKDAATAFKKFGDQIDRQGYGIISLTEKELNESIKYEYTASECAAWQVVPYVLKRGKDISGHGNHKDRSYATRTIAAPVVINDKKGVVGVVIRLTKGTKYKNHRILMPNGSEYVFESQKDAEPTFAGVKGDNHRQGPAISSASNPIISQNPKKSTPEVKKSKKIQPSYAGDKSKTANHSLLAQALSLEAQGVDSEEIRQKTGWFKSYDGKWRYEIDDSAMEILDFEVNKKTTLGKLIKHDKLFEAYPELRDLKVYVGERNHGFYSIDYNYISLGYNGSGDYSKFKSNLLHEIQHAIQMIEGFATGSSKEYWQQVFEEENREEYERLEFEENAAREEFHRTHSDEENALVDEYVGIEVHRIVLPPSRGIKNRDITRQNEIEKILRNYGSFDDFKPYLDAAVKVYKFGKSEPYEHRYMQTAGEIEARDVSSRMNLTSEQRKNTRPDIDQDEVYFSDYSVKPSHNMLVASPQSVTVNDDESKYSDEFDGVSEGVGEKITAGMSEAERANILRETIITPSEIKILDNFDLNIEYLNKNRKSLIEKTLIKKMREMGCIKNIKLLPWMFRLSLLVKDYAKA